MPLYFLDSSAVVKHYHPEPGSDEVNRFLTEPNSRFFISRLGIVEVQRTFVKHYLPVPFFLQAALKF